MTTDVSSYMFGSILAMTKEDVALAVVLSLVVLGLFVICYNQMFAVTFDENFARATGVNVGFYNMVISVLTAVTIVLGMRMMGAMLISSLVIFPCLTSMRVFKSFGGVMISSGLLSLTACPKRLKNNPFLLIAFLSGFSAFLFLSESKIAARFPALPLSTTAT